MRHVPRVEIMEAGLPCSGASTAGRAKRKTALPEDHPEVGHLVVAALVILAKANPAVVLFENVIPYASSASASILRNQLRDLGYTTHETVLKGEDFNAFENRQRWCMVAVTEGMHFDWDMLVMPEKKDMLLSDALDDIPLDSPMWSEMKGLKDKQARDMTAGKGFRMQIFSGDESSIGTITKGYAKVRSTDPKIQHPTNADLLRQLTPAEHARLKQHPPHLIAGLSATLAHEMLGQSIVRAPFVKASETLGQSILNFVNGLDVKPENMDALIAAMQVELTDSASLVVSELRQPLRGVIYEGPITVSDAGAVIQDVGNGVGILHRADALDAVHLGDVMRVQYKPGGLVEAVKLSNDQAPSVTPELHAALAKQAPTQNKAEQQQFDLLSPSPHPSTTPSRGMRM